MPIDDRQIVRRCLAGEQAAFATLYDRHSPRVFHLLRRLSGSQADAEDLTQETFLAAFRSLPNWRGDSTLGIWLCGIAFRQYASARRHQSRHMTEPFDEETDLPSHDFNPLERCTRQQAHQRIEAAIASLPDTTREAFVLVKVEGLSYRQAAEWLDIPLGTLQSRLNRAIRQLQTALTTEEPGEPVSPEMQKGDHHALRNRA